MAFKVTLIGESGVGKTCIMERLVHNKFITDIKSTIGISFENPIITTNDGSTSIVLWDTAGQEKYNAILPMYVRRSNAILIIFDMCSINTLICIFDRWIPFIRENIKSKCLYYIIGNKKDLIDHHNSNVDEINDIIDDMIENNSDMNIKFMTTSAKSGENINDIFKTIVNDLKSNKETKTCDTFKINNKNTKKSKKKSCC